MSKTTKILLKRSSVAGKAPTADIMEQGEAFVNLAKGTEHLYFKNAANEVIATKLGPLDKELDETSKNGVENQAIAKEYNELKKQLDFISSIYSIYGFARVHGDNSPDGTIFFGEDSNLEKITSHFHMGLTTKEGKLYKQCANCRLDVADDGTPLKIDGTDGDVMLFTDSKLYFLKATVAAPSDLNLGNGVHLNIIAFGMSPFSIYGAQAKAFDPFALSPQYTVNCQIEGVDDNVCAHSIYAPLNPDCHGSYTSPLPAFNESFISNAGCGYPSVSVSSLQSVWYAQSKNIDGPKTNRPYMGGYYEFYEIFIALMFCELKSLYHQNITSFGTGCGVMNNDTEAMNSFGNRAMYGNSGVMFVDRDGISSYRNLYESSTFGEYSPITGLCGEEYAYTEMLEPDRILNDIAKAGLISKIWNGTDFRDENNGVLFVYDSTGNIKVSQFPCEVLITGEEMVPNRKYYQVRSVPHVKGMADGAMTAVINIYVKMTFKDGFKVAGVDYTGGYAVYKFSHPVYRGMCLSDGAGTQLQGCYYVNCCDETNLYPTYFKCAENVDDIPAQQLPMPVYFGPINTTLETERGLTKVVQVMGLLELSSKKNLSNWIYGADYNASLLCYTSAGGSISTSECTYLSCNASYDNQDQNQIRPNGLPTAGRKCVNSVIVGVAAINGNSSFRTVTASSSVVHSAHFCSGRFSIPHLQL